MLSYLARDDMPNPEAGPMEILATVFCPFLFRLGKGVFPLVAVVVLGLSAGFSFLFR